MGESNNRKVFLRRLALLTTVVIVGSVVLYTTWRYRKESLVRGALERGAAAYDRGDWDVARHELGQYLAANPEDLERLHQYAEAQLRVRPARLTNLKQVEATYRQILRQAPRDERAFQRLFVLYENSRRFRDLEFICSIWDPQDPRAALGAGMHATFRSDYASAEESLDQAITLATEAVAKTGAEVPPTARSAALADALVKACAFRDALRLERVTGALRDPNAVCVSLNQAVRLVPGSPLARAMRGSLLRELAERVTDAESRAVLTARANEDLRAASDGDDPRAWLIAADEWLRLGRLDEAGGVLTRGAAVDPDALTEHYLDPRDWQVALFRQAARVALSVGDVAACAQRARALMEALEEERYRLAITALAIRVLAANGAATGNPADTDLAGTWLAEYQQALALAGVATGENEELTHLEALIMAAEGEWHAVINSLAPRADSASQESLALLLQAFVATDQVDRAAQFAGRVTRGLPPDLQAELARRELAAGNFGAADSRIRALEAVAPAARETRLLRLGYLAARATSAGELAPIESETAALVQEHPTDTRARIFLAALLDRRGAAAEVEAQLQTAIASGDQPLDARLALAAHYRERERPDDALATLEAACQDQPAASQAWIALVDLHADRGDLDAAGTALEQALAAVGDAGRRALLTRRALLELARRDQRSAATTLLQLAMAEPTDRAVTDLLFRIPLVWRDEKLRDDAGDLITAMQTQTGGPAGPGIEWRLAQARGHIADLTRLGPQERAARVTQTEGLLRTCLVLNPRETRAAAMLGGLYESMGRWSDAEAVYRSSLSQVRALQLGNALLRVLRMQGKDQAAEEALVQLSGLLGEAQRTRRAAWRAFAAGELERAVTMLNRYISEEGTDPQAFIDLAFMEFEHYRDIKRLDARLRNAVERGVDPLRAAELRARALLVVGEAEAAAAVLDELVAERDSPAVYRLRGAFRTARRLFDDAQADFRRFAELTPNELGPAVLGEFYAHYPADEVDRQAECLDEAIATWEAGLAAYPDSERLRRGLAKALYLRNGDGDAARAGTLIGGLSGLEIEDPDFLLLQALGMLTPAGETGLRVELSGLGAAQRSTVIALLRRALDAGAGRPELYLQLAALAVRLADTDLATALLERGLRFQPGDVSLQAARAELAAEGRDWATVRRLAESVLLNAPTDAAYFGAVATATDALVACALAEGDTRQLVMLERLLGVRCEAMETAAPPTSATPAARSLQRLHARTLHMLGRHDEAARKLGSLTAGEQGEPDELILLFDVELAVRRFAEAATHLDRLEHHWPDHPQIARKRIAWFAAQDRWDELIACAGAWQSPTAAQVMAQLDAAERLAQVEGFAAPALRLAELAAAHAEGPGQQLAGQMLLASLHYSADDRAAAVRAYRAALAIDAALPEALNNLAWILTELGSGVDVAEPVELARRAIALVPESPDNRTTLANYHDTLGAACSRAGQVDGALEAYLSSARYAPDDRLASRALFRAGTMAESLGRADQLRNIVAQLARLRDHVEYSDADRQKLQTWEDALGAQGQ